MSHIVGAKFNIMDLDALERALPALGLELRRNQTNYRWYGSWMNDYSKDDAAYKSLGIKPEDYGKCEHAIAVIGNSHAYEIGLVRVPGQDGYQLIYDFYGGGHGLVDKIGGNAGHKLRQAYAVQEQLSALAEYEQQGFLVSQDIDAHGQVHLFARRA